MTGANLVVWIVTLVTQFCLVQATSQDSQRKTSDRFTGAERVGIGIAIVIFCIGMFLLVPGLRRYLAYEIEINKKDNMSILVARGLAMLAFLFQAGDIFNNFFMSTDSDFQCITPGCGNNWEDIHGNPTRFISNFVMFKGTAATLAIAVTQQVLLWLTPNLRGLTLYFVLIFISVVQYVSWYLAYMAGFPRGIEAFTMVYQFIEWISMATAIFLMRNHYGYNDTLFGNQMADEPTSNKGRPSGSFCGDVSQNMSDVYYQMPTPND